MVNNSFDFTKVISQQNSTLFTASLDVDSFLTNVPLDEIIDICVTELFMTSQTVLGLKKTASLKMLLLTTKENITLFDEHYYKQIDGVAMGSPLINKKKIHKSITFSFETKKDNTFSIFDVKTFRENLQSVFSEKIHSLVYSLILAVS